MSAYIRHLGQDVHVILKSGQEVVIEDVPYEGFVDIRATVELRIPVEQLAPGGGTEVDG